MAPAGWFCSQGNFTVVTPCDGGASTDRRRSFQLDAKKNDNNKRTNERTMESDRKLYHQHDEQQQRQQPHMNARDKSDYFRCRTRINANTCDENLNSWNMEYYTRLRIHLAIAIM